MTNLNFRSGSTAVFGWLAGQPPYEITVHVLPEQYFSLTTISRNSIFQSWRTGPSILSLFIMHMLAWNDYHFILNMTRLDLDSRYSVATNELCLYCHTLTLSFNS